MLIIRRFAGGFAIGAAVLACLIVLTACGGSQPAATPTGCSRERHGIQ